jgi:DNA invertase Pin-like site-specific DNA recombinase
MSKTEEKTTELMKKAKDFIPDGGYSEKELNLAFFMFIKGYNQAEKDLHKSIYKAGFLDGFEDAVEGQYEKGYKQAEKDLKLTLDDIKTIDKLLNQCVAYQEVLKRFKAIKETKD